MNPHIKSGLHVELLGLTRSNPLSPLGKWWHIAYNLMDSIGVSGVPCAKMRFCGEKRSSLCSNTKGMLLVWNFSDRIWTEILIRTALGLGLSFELFSWITRTWIRPWTF